MTVISAAKEMFQGQEGYSRRVGKDPFERWHLC